MNIGRWPRWDIKWYPFGISSSCYYPGDDSFNITCKEDRPYLFGDIEVTNFHHSGQLQVLLNRSSPCDKEQGNETISFSTNTFTLGNLSISVDNKIALVGCNAMALLITSGTKNYATVCISVCNSVQPDKGRCDGEGCCTADIPTSLDSYSVTTSSLLLQLPNQTPVHLDDPCVYAFLFKNGTFDFSSLEDLKNLRGGKRFPVELDWSIGNKTCEQVGNTSICGGNSTCSDSSTRGKGYICKCKDGHDGNPYLSNEHGCQDFNECTTGKHNCSDPNTCRDKVGGFECKCKFGYRLDTTTMSCKRKDFKWAMILIGNAIGLLFILLGLSCMQQKMKHRKDKLRQKFFEQNGGGLLLQRLSGASNVDFKIFTEEGMKEATNGYEESRILGQGGQGTVYKGTLPDNSVVAIKKARLGGDRSQVEQFINEMSMLLQINHRNVVKLLGCCLETEVPLLVYEFVTNGTLFDHLQGSMFESSLTWEHLVTYFACATKENRLHEIIDGQVMNEYNHREIQEAALIAVECTRLMGEERPKMKEVAAKLEGLRVTRTKHQWSDLYPAETHEHMICVESISAQGDTSSSGYDSIKNVARLHIEGGR